MALRLAPCPRCGGPIVFGERQCRACGQTFDYGAGAPPVPSTAEIMEALVAGGFAVAPTQPPTPQPAVAATASPAQVTEPRMAELDTGRFESPQQVQVQDVPGLLDSALFRTFTPAVVHAPPIEGLEQTAAARVGQVPTPTIPGVERSAVPVGEVQVQQVPGIFHSDFLKAPEGVPTPAIDGVERSPTASVAHTKARADAAKKKKDISLSALPKVVCRCGETHRLARCASCGTVHPDLA